MFSFHTLWFTLNGLHLTLKGLHRLIKTNAVYYGSPSTYCVECLLLAYAFYYGSRLIAYAFYCFMPLQPIMLNAFYCGLQLFVLCRLLHYDLCLNHNLCLQHLYRTSVILC